MKMYKALALVMALLMAGVCAAGCAAPQADPTAAPTVEATEAPQEEATPAPEEATEAPVEETTPAPETEETPAPADDQSLQKVLDAGQLVLGLDDSFPPMGFRDADNNIVGFDIDVAKAVCEKLGVELVAQPIDWTAKEQELNTGNIDCIWNGFSISDERKEQVDFSIPYMDNHMTMVVRSGEGIESNADLVGKIVGVQAGSTAQEALLAETELVESLASAPVEFKDNMTALMDLETGGVDAVFMDDVVANYYIAINEKNFTVLSDVLSEEEYAIGFRKGDTALVEAVNAALTELAEEGTLAEIATTWFGKDTTVVGK